MQGLRSLWRLFVIALVLRRHGALAPLRELDLAPGLLSLVRFFGRHSAPGRPGERLARALTELGPSFIKLGQVLSTRADLLGEEAAADLSQLQDRLPPFPTHTARETVERELKGEIDDLFQSFDENPVSAASIAQVHFAVTRDGEAVAVKVLRPGIEKAFERDLDFFTWLARMAERSQPKLRRFKPGELVALFEQQVRLEMDLRMEAAAIAELQENFAGDRGYVTPPVVWDLSSKRVLTMGRLTGIPMDDRAALLEAGHDLEAVLKGASEIFFKQVFRDGFFHGDQHPGNMFVDAEGRIAAVDFGIMGRLDRKTRTFLADMLLATLARDYRRLAEIHVEAGYLPRGPELETFAQALRSVCEPIMGKTLSEISFARLLAQLLQLTESFEMPVQPQLLLLQKNMLIAEGISRLLVPGLNIWTLAEPMIAEWMQSNRGPQARIRETGEALLRQLSYLPETLRNLDEAAERLAREGVRISPEARAALAAGQRRSSLHIALVWATVLVLGLIVVLD